MRHTAGALWAAVWSIGCVFSQAVGMILADDKLSLSGKADLLRKFQISRLNKMEEDRLMRLILFDSRHLEVKRELISRYHFQLTPDQKKKLKQFVLKNTEV